MVSPRSLHFVGQCSFWGALIAIAGCSQTPQARLEPPPGYAARASASGEAAAPVKDPTVLGVPHDDDGDGFISPAETEGLDRRYFGQLDEDGDGRLSRAELEAEAPGPRETAVAGEEPVGVIAQENLADRLRRYQRRADPPIGMMSTRDLDEMLGGLEPAIGGSRPRFMP